MKTATPPAAADVLAARRALGLTQTEAGRIIHASQRTWQQWEAGLRKMHPAFWELFTAKTRRARVKASQTQASA